MTAYEIVSIFVGILTLLIAFGGFVIALLAFLDKRNKYKNQIKADGANPSAFILTENVGNCLLP